MTLRTASDYGRLTSAADDDDQRNMWQAICFNAHLLPSGFLTTFKSFKARKASFRMAVSVILFILFP